MSIERASQGVKRILYLLDKHGASGLKIKGEERKRKISIV